MSQEVQTERRLRRVAGSFGQAARQTQARIRQSQQVLLEEQHRKKEEEERKLNRRIFLATRGARRLIACGKSRAMQQIIRANDCVRRNTIIPFFNVEWLWIGTQVKRQVCCTFQKDGVVIEVEDRCWVTHSKVFTLSYSEKEVLFKTGVAWSFGEEEKLSLEQFLQSIATTNAVNFARLNVENEEPTEDEVAFQFLIRQSRKEAFEKDFEAYLKNLERALNQRVAEAV